MEKAAHFVYRKSDGVFLGGGWDHRGVPTVAGPPDANGNPTQVPDAVNYGIAEFGDADLPDLKRHRYDPATGKRLATAQELADAADADVASQAQLTSRQKDILAMVALMVRQRDVAAWNAMTLPQKRAAVLVAADQWRDLRVLVEKVLEA